MQKNEAVEVVRAWQEAANAGDAERLLALSDPGVEIVGPRGSGYGHQLLRDWLARAGLTVTPLRCFARGDVVVVAQQGRWRSVETGEPLGEQPIASRFRVADGRVTLYARYDSLDEALADAGLGEADEQVR